MTEMWIVVGLCAVLGVPFTLWWWKIADRWADAEHKRFKPKPKPKGNAVVVKLPPLRTTDEVVLDRSSDSAGRGAGSV